MKPCLADLGLLIAAVHADHEHHAAAARWVEARGAGEIVLCRLVTLGYLRLLTNPRVMGASVLAAKAAWAELEAIERNPRCRYASEPDGVMELMRSFTSGRTPGGATWSDAYLAAFARRAGLKLATLDRGTARFPVEIELVA